MSTNNVVHQNQDRGSAIAPANGELGIMMARMGAVATT